MNIYRILNRFSVYNTKAQGEGFQYTLQLFQNNQVKSFWHDVQLYDGNSINIGIEIPKERLAKFEVSKTLPFNPIVQDTKKNSITQEKQLRYYAQFPCFNYGFIPQTWENSLKELLQGYKGDDDPLDVLEIGISKQVQVGQILNVTVIGAFCVLDQGEVDWKIITLNTEEAKQLNIRNFSQIEQSQPGKGQQLLDWFRYIKTFDGKKPNQILFNGQIFDSDKAQEIIHETNQYWKELRTDSQFIEKRKQFNITS